MCLVLWSFQVLLLSAGVSFLLAFFDESSQHEGLRAYVEPFVILLILFLNAAVGVWQESRSEAALEALKELQSEHAKVIREGKMVSMVLHPWITVLLTQRLRLACHAVCMRSWQSGGASKRSLELVLDG